MGDGASSSWSEGEGEGNTENLNCWGFWGLHSWTEEQSWVFHIFPVLKGLQLPIFSKWEFTNLKMTQKQQILAWMCCSPEVTMICPSDLHVAPEIYSSRNMNILSPFKAFKFSIHFRWIWAGKPSVHTVQLGVPKWVCPKIMVPPNHPF